MLGEFQVGLVLGKGAVDLVGADLQKSFHGAGVGDVEENLGADDVGLRRKAPEPRMERSTCVSAAKLTTWVIVVLIPDGGDFIGIANIAANENQLSSPGRPADWPDCRNR